MSASVAVHDGPVMIRTTPLRATALALALAALPSMPSPAAAATTPAPAPSGYLWRKAMADPLARADTAARTLGSSPMAWANMARASARSEGWRSSRTTGYIAKVLAARHRDGGWGLDEPADAFGDGTVNPASTTYSVTVADHVGPLLLEGLAAGVVRREVVDGAVTSLMRMPRVVTARGTCVSYSSSPHDRATATRRCVHNANAATGWFLEMAARAGVERPGQRALAASILRYDAAAQLPTGMWPYSNDTTKPQDLDHNALNVEAQHVMSGPTPLTRAVAAAHYAAPMTTDYTDHLSRLRAVVADPGRCRGAYPHSAAMRTKITRLAQTTAGRTTNIVALRHSQVALWDSRAMVVCRTGTL